MFWKTKTARCKGNLQGEETSLELEFQKMKNSPSRKKILQWELGKWGLFIFHFYKRENIIDFAIWFMSRERRGEGVQVDLGL